MAETQTIVRSRTKSFRDIHVAIVTKNTETEYATDTPTKLARAITGKISDMQYTGTEVEFEVNALAPQDKSRVFGHLYKKGYLVKNKNDKAPEVAVGWRAKKLNGKYEFCWMYAGRFDQGLEDNYETEGASTNTQTATLKGNFYERQVDGNYKVEVDEGNLLEADTSAAAAIANWFASVQELPKTGG